MRARVSLPDELFDCADKLAAELGKSRSELYSDAVAEYLQRRHQRSITAAYDAVLAEVGREIDPWVAEVGRRLLERSEW